MKGYDTAEYARSRLSETIIRLGDVPVIVTNCVNAGKQIVVHYQVVDGDGSTQIAPLDDFNLDPVPLGYVNYDKEAVYISRMPMRKDWRQGLRGINIVNVDGSNMYNLPYKTIVNTILGKFPTLNSALEALNKTTQKAPRSLAFCRDFCVAKEGDLKYKDKFRVGTVDMTSGTVKVDDKFNWIREALEESLTVN